MLHLPEPETTRQLSTFDPHNGVKVAFIEPGERRTIGSIDGAGYLARLWMTLPGWFWAAWEPERDVDAAILEHTIVRVYVDGAEQAQIVAPVADLFGLGLSRVRNYATRWVGASSGGFYLTLPMPFSASIRVEVENLHPTMRVDLFCNALIQLTPRAAELPVLHGVRTAGRHSGPGQVRLLEIQGTGRYIGCTMSCQGQNRAYLGYLEAPEHLVLDGHTVTGTGMEDYFLGGWYFREGPFAGPDHAVPLKDPLDSAVSMLRFHEHDAFWFRESLRMYFESPWAAERQQPYAHSALAFLYLDEPQSVPDVATSDLGHWFRRHQDDHLSLP
ncbi:DUF2961 domain-containing protein [Pseudactinotalea sp.]|uniref:DUF2961 domain-containing protein n=1 Tax=Pseudactinotalea sp. TaxID=1926260 RepID=UPI003B3A462D